MTQPKGTTTSAYRYDLDGLRGIAIAFVVIFHVFVGKVSGGVDVFLFLSGYFFLGGQLRYAQRPNASSNVWWPLWRTVRRLVPVLAVVLIATMSLLSIVTPELKQLDTGRQLFASLFYYQNWELIWQGQDYGAASNVVSPLQHLWSMSVQGQFYVMAILFGALMTIYVRRTKRPIRPVAGPLLVLATVASMWYAMTASNQEVNYYSTWSRMWELTLGALFVVYGGTKPLPNPLRRLLTAVGVAMVLTTGLLFDGAQQFPGVAALYPIGGAAIIVLAGHGSGWLASRPMRELGRIAYPLYLWHWPMLIVVTAYTKEARPSVIVGIGVVLVSLVLAYVSHIWIEEPLRQHAARPVRGEQRFLDGAQSLGGTAGVLRAFCGVVVASLMVMALTIPSEWRKEVEALQNYHLDPRLYPGAMAVAGARVPNAPYEPDPYLLAETLSPGWTNGCMSNIGDDPRVIPSDSRPEACTFGDPEAETVAYILGGSHAEQWTAAFDLLGKQQHFRVIPMTRQGCPSFATEQDGVFSESCQAFNQVVMERLRQDPPDFVISNSTRPLLEKGHGRDEVPASYPTLWTYLRQLGIPFVGLRDNPWFILEDGAMKMVSQCVDKTGDVRGCGMEASIPYADEDPSTTYLTNEDEVRIDTAKWLCPDGFCSPVIGNIYVYRDGNHLSDDFVRSTVPLIWEKIGRLVQRAEQRTEATTLGTTASTTPSASPSAPSTNTSTPTSSSASVPTSSSAAPTS